jgi:hypothetical protein
MKTTWIAYIMVVAFLVSLPASAQMDDEMKNLMFFSGLYDTQPTTISAPRTLAIYIEEATYNPSWEREPSASLEVGFIRNLFSGFSVGLALQGVRADATERFTAEIPHPFYFNQPRGLEGENTNLSYRERAIHIPIGFTKTQGRLVVFLGAGPSYFLTKTEIIDDLNVAETYPYTTVTLRSVDPETYDANVLGFNVGALLGVRLANNFALGADLRFSRGKASFTTDQGSEVEYDTGGFWVGVGMQILF